MLWARNNMRRAVAAAKNKVPTCYFGHPWPILMGQEGVEGVIRGVSSGGDNKKTESRTSATKSHQAEIPLITPSTPSCSAGTVVRGSWRDHSSDCIIRPNGSELLFAATSAWRQCRLAAAQRKAEKSCLAGSPTDDRHALVIGGATLSAWSGISGTSCPDWCSHRTSPAIRPSPSLASPGSKTKLGVMFWLFTELPGFQYQSASKGSPLHFLFLAVYSQLSTDIGCKHSLNANPNNRPIAAMAVGRIILGEENG
jgi:hypothetical protein